MALTREQRKVARTILKVGRRSGASRREQIAALETGLVESSLRNLPGGEGSSVGWRQETASSYPNVNRRDVAGGARRFFSETHPIAGKYGKAGNLAQAVQRSAYPRRYNQRKREALDIYHALGKGGRGSSPGASTKTIPGVDRSGDRRALIAQYLLNDTVQTPSTNPLTMLKRSGAGLDKLLALQGQLKGVQDTPSRKVRVKSSGGSGGARRASQRYTGPLRELFWQGQGGVNVKNGTHEPQGFVSGHRDHVHVAANRNTIIKLGTLAQSMGLHVGENPRFGGVHPVHVAGSNHYIGRAIDVSGDPTKMRAYAHKVARIFGV